jgi:deoxyinosine 3'endonuclease (endonuclease V)
MVNVAGCQQSVPTVGLAKDRLCGLVARVLGYRSGGPGSIPGTTKKMKSNGSGTGSTQPREYN